MIEQKKLNKKNLMNYYCLSCYALLYTFFSPSAKKEKS